MKIIRYLTFNNDNIQANKEEVKMFVDNIYYDLFELFWTKTVYEDINKEIHFNRLFFSKQHIGGFNKENQLIRIELIPRYENREWANIEDLKLISMLQIISKKYPNLNLFYNVGLGGTDSINEEYQLLQYRHIKNGEILDKKNAVILDVLELEKMKSYIA